MRGRGAAIWEGSASWVDCEKGPWEQLRACGIRVRGFLEEVSPSEV